MDVHARAHTHTHTHTVTHTHARTHTHTLGARRTSPLWMEWALLEWQGAKDVAAARTLFQKGAAVPPNRQHAPLYEAWAQMEMEVGGKLDLVEQLRAKAAEVFGMRQGAGRVAGRGGR